MVLRGLLAVLLLGAGAPRALALRGAAVAALQQEAQLALQGAAGAALQQEAQLALQSAARGDDCSYSAKSTLADCPAGFSNHGITCFRNADTAKKLGSRPNRYCPDGFTDVGAFCAREAKTLSADSMTCPENRFRKGGRCYEKCIAGFTNGGEVCTNWDCVKVGWEVYVANPLTCKLGLKGSLLARAGEGVLGSLLAWPCLFSRRRQAANRNSRRHDVHRVQDQQDYVRPL
jgi:hypothetical protein